MKERYPVDTRQALLKGRGASHQAALDHHANRL